MTRTVLERYKAEDDAVIQFLYSSYGENGWEAQYAEKCTDKGQDYKVALVRRRYGYKIQYDKEYWYNISNTRLKKIRILPSFV